MKWVFMGIKNMKKSRHYYRLVFIATYSIKDDRGWNLKEQKRHIYKCLTEEEVEEWREAGYIYVRC